MKVNVAFFWAKFLKLIDRPALRNSTIDKTAVIGAGSNCINTIVGRYTYTGKNNSIVNAEIGAFCSIASYCAIGGSGHDISAVSTSPVFFNGRNALRKNFGRNDMNPSARVSIGNDVWIGEGVYISEGITIGNGAVVGAHSVVTHNVEPYTIVAGVPARKIRKRFNDETIDVMQHIQWWNWSEDKLKKYGKYFMKPDELIKNISGDQL